jgi:hypothetical protein
VHLQKDEKRKVTLPLAPNECHVLLDQLLLLFLILASAD